MTDSNESRSYVSLPQEATPAGVSGPPYQRAWECGMKSMAIYRYGKSLRKRSILGSSRKCSTAITRLDEIRLSATYDT